MGYVLRERLFFCIAEGRAVFLDLSTARYFCLATHANEAFKNLVTGAPIKEDDQHALAPLLSKGLLQPSQDHGLACTSPIAATSSLIDEIEDRPPISLLPGILHSLAVAAVTLRNQPLGRIIDDIQRRKTRSGRSRSPPGSDRVFAIAKAFDWSSRFTSSHNKCLWRSIAMMDHLTRRRLRSELVFGVRTRPFSAHCWVQREGRVLNDALDHVRNFTPILVV